MTTVQKENDAIHTIPDIAPELERGPKWLRNRRYQSRDDFNAMPLPRRGLHFWRYTDPSKYLIDRNAITDTAFDKNRDQIHADLHRQLADGHLSGLVLDLGGREIIIETSESLDKAGVVICRLSEAVETHSELVEKYLYKLVNSATGKFEAMNGALWNDGIFIYVPNGKTIEQPIHLMRESGLANSVQFPRLLTVIGENAEVTLVDEYSGGAPDIDNGVSYGNGAVEIFGLANSRTRYVTVQRHENGMLCYLTHRAQIEAGATMLTIPLAFGSSLSKASYGVTLNGKNSESNMYGLLFGKEHQHFDNHTLHHHAVGETTSNIDFKVVVRDKANSAYTGLIRIDHSAKTCEAYQENRNLLLNRGAKAETIPELEILNEDVRCSHGATVGQIDPEAIFYLKARGIDQSTAVRIIVAGFVASTLDRLPGDLKDRITDYVMQRLEDI
ncbi:MAG TPA: Fe-S cluster assembly protein SufD [candidate division Zixibacteria bacterium]|nr:Fe-S cluster assembly protein SufD [candidate division Zixibacteria bacterium]